jgi:hypothetical protein
LKASWQRKWEEQKKQVLMTTSLGFRAKGIAMSFVMFMFELNTLESGHVAVEKFKPLNQKEGVCFCQVTPLAHLVMIAPSSLS